MWNDLHRLTLRCLAVATGYALMAAALGLLHETPARGVLTGAAASALFGACTCALEATDGRRERWRVAVAALARVGCALAAGGLVFVLLGRWSPAVATVLATVLALAASQLPSRASE